MEYKELQARASELGINPIQKKEDLINAIEAKEKGLPPPSPAPMRKVFTEPQSSKLFGVNEEPGWYYVKVRRLEGDERDDFTELSAQGYEVAPAYKGGKHGEIIKDKIWVMRCPYEQYEARVKAEQEEAMRRLRPTKKGEDHIVSVERKPAQTVAQYMAESAVHAQAG